MCCDGSVKDRLGSFSYGLAPPGTDNLLLKKHSPVHGDLDQITSTRCELMGIYACIKYLQYISDKYTFERRHFILITADNSSAVSSSSKDYSSIRHAFLTDGDIIWSIIKTIRFLPFRIRINHVKGHQDKSLTYDNLSPLAKLNVQMDQFAKAFFTNPINAPRYNVFTPFLPAETVSLYDCHSRITNNIRQTLTRMSVGYTAELQIAKTLQIPDYNLKYIDWINLKRARNSLPPYQQLQFTKFLYRQFPVMERNFQWKMSNTSSCPLCSSTAETIEHLFQCKSLSVIQTRNDAFNKIKKFLLEYKTEPTIQRHILRMLRQFFGNFPISPISHHNDETKNISQALNIQISLGTSNMIRGIVTWKLTLCQQEHYSTLRETRYTGDIWTKKLILQLFDMIKTIWKKRCDLVANSTEQTHESRIRNQCKSLFFSLTNDMSQIPQSLRYMTNKSNAFFQKARPRALQSWLTRLQNGIASHQSPKYGPTDIRRWITPVSNTSTNVTFPTDDDSTDSDDDDTICWFDQYPDEHPSIDTWDRFTPHLRHPRSHNNQHHNKQLISKNTFSPPITHYFQDRSI